MKINGISVHATERYMERSGCKDKIRANNQLFQLAKNANVSEDRLALNIYHCDGWDLVINQHGWIETAYRRSLASNNAKMKKRRRLYA